MSKSGAFYVIEPVSGPICAALRSALKDIEPVRCGTAAEFRSRLIDGTGTVGDGGFVRALVVVDLDAAGEEAYGLKADPIIRRIPIVGLVGQADEAALRRHYEKGLNSVLQKPASASDLAPLLDLVRRYWFDYVELPALR